MKTQTIINIVFAVAFVGYVVWSRNPTFGTIKCEGWEVVYSDAKERISAYTDGVGAAYVEWRDRDKKVRILAATLSNGQAGVQWLHKGEGRIVAATLADGTVLLPTKDFYPPKEP